MTNKLKRNTLAVRLTDDDYDEFIQKTGKNYSTVLRELIRVYNEKCLPELLEIPLRLRVREVFKQDGD